MSFKVYHISLCNRSRLELLVSRSVVRRKSGYAVYILVHKYHGIPRFRIKYDNWLKL